MYLEPLTFQAIKYDSDQCKYEWAHNEWMDEWNYGIAPIKVFLLVFLDLFAPVLNPKLPAFLYELTCLLFVCFFLPVSVLNGISVNMRFACISADGGEWKEVALISSGHHVQGRGINSCLIQATAMLKVWIWGVGSSSEAVWGVHSWSVATLSGREVCLHEHRENIRNWI